MRGKKSDLLLIKLLIFLLSAGSGFLRIIIAKDLNQLDLVLDSGLIIGYFTLPAVCILVHKGSTPTAQRFNSIAPRFFYFLLQLSFIGYLLLWIYISILRYGLDSPHILLPCAMDFANILLLIGNYALDRESPKWLE
jgi:hypothetical protein